MKTNYILIDYENVQPKSLAVLKGHDFKVIVFVGANQTKIPIDLAKAMQALGSSGEYIIISGNGPNALDFHIAYYIGELAAKLSVTSLVITHDMFSVFNIADHVAMIDAGVVRFQGSVPEMKSSADPAVVEFLERYVVEGF